MSESKPIYSMTGFGRGTFVSGPLTISVECKSLNSRYLEVTCKLPRLHAALEVELRQHVQKYVSRGRVELLVSRKVDAVADEQVAGKQISLMAELQRRLTELECQYSSLGISIDNSQRFEIARQLINSGNGSIEEELLSDSEIDAVKKAVQMALMQLQKQRSEEARRLTLDLAARLDQLTEDVGKLRSKAGEVPKLLRERITERVKAAVASVTAIDDARLTQEIVLLVDKADVTEELVRLDSHIQLFTDTLKAGGLVGKRLDFVCQEIFRELNTLGGKSASAEIQALVVACKVELERIREQVQNLE